MTGLTALNTAVLDVLREAVALQPAADAALVGLSAGPDPVGLLDYHQQILRHTMRYACTLDHIADRAALSPRQANAGLGAPGEELRAILRRFDR